MIDNGSKSEAVSGTENLLESDSEEEKTDIQEVEEEIAKMEARFSSDRKTGKTLGRLALIFTMITAISSLFLLVIPLFSKQNHPWWWLVPSLMLLLTIVLFFGQAIVAPTADMEAELAGLIAKRKFLAATDEQVGTGKHSTSYFTSLVQINVQNLREYYKLVQLHTANSYRAALYASLVGFALILIGLIIGYTSNGDSASNGDPIIAYISAGAGILMQFVASIFFVLYNRTVQQLKVYHDSLLFVQNILLSIRLLDETSSTQTKDNVLSSMVDYLMSPSSVMSNESSNEKE